LQRKTAAGACGLSRVRRLTSRDPVLRDPIRALDGPASTDAFEPEETGLPSAAGDGRLRESGSKADSSHWQLTTSALMEHVRKFALDNAAPLGSAACSG
jgi:hypothetical protein